MRRLGIHNLEDRLLLDFEGAFDPQAALESELEPFLQALEEYAGEWMPDVVEGKRRRKYSRAAIWKALEEKRDESSADIVLGRTKWPALYVWLTLAFPPRPPELSIWLEVQPLSFFAEAERCRKFVEMVCSWAARYPVPYASAHSMADRELSGDPYRPVARADGGCFPGRGPGALTGWVLGAAEEPLRDAGVGG